MEKYSTTQISHLKEVNKQIEARLTRTVHASLTNEWKQKQSMINYQSEHDRIIKELSNSALPFQTQEGVIKRKAELERIRVHIVNSTSEFNLY